MLGLIGNEYKKLYKNMGLLLLALALLLGKGAYLLWQIHFDDTKGYTAAQERDLFVKLKGAGEEEAVCLQRLSNELLEEMRQIAERAAKFPQGQNLAGGADGHAVGEPAGQESAEMKEGAGCQERSGAGI